MAMARNIMDDTNNNYIDMLFSPKEMLIIFLEVLFKADDRN